MRCSLERVVAGIFCRMQIQCLCAPENENLQIALIKIKNNYDMIFSVELKNYA